MSSIIDSIAAAIARQEGYLDNRGNVRSGTIATNNHNPGNLRSWGSNPVVNGYAVFPSDQAGWDALKRQIQLNIDRGLTLEEFFAGKPGVYAGYAPATDRNQPLTYAANVSSWTGVPLGTPLRSVVASHGWTGELPAAVTSPVTSLPGVIDGGFDWSDVWVTDNPVMTQQDDYTGLLAAALGVGVLVALAL